LIYVNDSGAEKCENVFEEKLERIWSRFVMEELNKKTEKFSTASASVQIGTACLLGTNQTSKLFAQIMATSHGVVKCQE
jgi:hypothetical protein